MKKYNVVGFLAREHGLEGLNSLIESEKYNPICVFTHSRLPSFQYPQHGERQDWKDFVKISKRNSVPFYSIDSKKENDDVFDILFLDKEIDLFAVISWRRLIEGNVINLAQYGGVNLHRGKFPEYTGDKPIVRAVQAGEKEIYVTGHELEEGIDTGEVLVERKHPVNYDESQSFDENVERLKKEITPYYGPMLIESLDMMVEKNER